MTPEPMPWPAAWPISIWITAGLSALATSWTVDWDPGSFGAATVGVVAEEPEDSSCCQMTIPTVASSAAISRTTSQVRLRDRGLSGWPTGAGSSAGGSAPSPARAIRWSGSGGGRKSATGGVAGRSRHVRRGGKTGIGVVVSGGALAGLMTATVRSRG